MVSKIGRIVPLAISGVVLIGFLINFKHFGLYFNSHFEWGAGQLYGEWGFVAPAPLFARFFLHLSFFGLFLSGILLFVRYKSFSKAALLIISSAMFMVFLLRPVITLVNFFMDVEWPNSYNRLFESFAIPTFTGQLIGNLNDEGQYNSLTLFQGYLTGIILLLLLVANLILSVLPKQDSVHVEQRQTRMVQPQYAQPMRMPVQPQGASTSMTQELERLQQLHQSGGLTEAEFTEAKKRVLGN